MFYPDGWAGTSANRHQHVRTYLLNSEFQVNCSFKIELHNNLYFCKEMKLSVETSVTQRITPTMTKTQIHENI